MAQRLKCLPGIQETRVRSLGWEDPLEKEMATHSSTLAWRIPWREEPGSLQSMGSQRVRHDWATSLSRRREQWSRMLVLYRSKINTETYSLSLVIRSSFNSLSNRSLIHVMRRKLKFNSVQFSFSGLKRKWKIIQRHSLSGLRDLVQTCACCNKHHPIWSMWSRTR